MLATWSAAGVCFDAGETESTVINMALLHELFSYIE